MKKPNPAKPPVDILSRLTNIYQKFTRARRISSDSQMCEFWEDPTEDVLVGSHELDTIETEFGIEFDDDSAMELYDMTLGEAAVLIGKMVKEQSSSGYDSAAFISKMNHPTAKEVLLELWRNHEKTRPAILEALERVDHEKKLSG